MLCYTVTAPILFCILTLYSTLKSAGYVINNNSSGVKNDTTHEILPSLRALEISTRSSIGIRHLCFFEHYFVIMYHLNKLLLWCIYSLLMEKYEFHWVSIETVYNLSERKCARHWKPVSDRRMTSNTFICNGKILNVRLSNK